MVTTIPAVLQVFCFVHLRIKRPDMVRPYKVRDPTCAHHLPSAFNLFSCHATPSHVPAPAAGAWRLRRHDHSLCAGARLYARLLCHQCDGHLPGCHCGARILLPQGERAGRGGWARRFPLSPCSLALYHHPFQTVSPSASPSSLALVFLCTLRGALRAAIGPSRKWKITYVDVMPLGCRQEARTHTHTPSPSPSPHGVSPCNNQPTTLSLHHRTSRPPSCCQHWRTWSGIKTATPRRVKPEKGPVLAAQCAMPDPTAALAAL